MKAYSQLLLLLLLLMSVLGGYTAEHGHAGCEAALCHASHAACAHSQPTAPELQEEEHCKHHHLPCIHLTEGDSQYSPAAGRHLALIGEPQHASIPHAAGQRLALPLHRHEPRVLRLPLLLPLLC